MEQIKIKGAALAVKRVFDQSGLDSGWCVSNAYVINSAISKGLALCGSAGVGVATGNPVRIPKDLDFVTNDYHAAKAFVNQLEDFLSRRSVFYTKLVNHRTKFCPQFVTSHIRIKCPLWMEICVFVVDVHLLELDVFFRDGCRVQNYRQMYEAAEELEERDDKKRVHVLPEEFEECVDFEGTVPFGEGEHSSPQPGNTAPPKPYAPKRDK